MEQDHSNSLAHKGVEAQDRLPFSTLLTLLCFLMCVAGVGVLVWTVSLSDGLRRSTSESRDLERIASRMLGFESRLTDLSSFEQLMYRLGGQDGETEEQVRAWYEEAVESSSRPMDQLYLGILYGEAGLTGQLQDFVSDWNGDKTSSGFFRQVLETAYADDKMAGLDHQNLQAKLAEEIPATWFYFRLAQQLAEKAGNQALQRHLHAQFIEMTEPPLQHWRLLLAGEVILVGLGVIMALPIGIGQRSRWNRSGVTPGEGHDVPWTFAEGVAVLVRGGALSIALLALVAFLPHGARLLEQLGFMLLYLPTVILASLLLCRPRHCSLLRVLGCGQWWHRIRFHLPLIVLVTGLGLVGDWMIMIVGERFQSSVHWTEWFVPQLVWGTPLELVKISIEFVLVAPLFEELIFRGLLFTTLRKKLRFPLAMMASGLIFAAVHGYGVIAFLSVLWSGCLWAWTYERTGSVIPGICAHALNNGLVVYSLIAIFR